MAVGEEITVCTDAGKELFCRLSRIRDDEVTAEILSERESASEMPLSVTLYMAYPKGDKLETVVQKAVELGAARIVPFLSERCIRRPKPEKLQAERERLSRIAGEAAKQCGRGLLPEVLLPLSFDEMLRAATADSVALFCYEGEGTRPISRLLEGQRFSRLSVIVGSEGGFSDGEAEAARAAGCKMTGLGPRILRCETAPLYALSAISVLLEL
jgi:16S rRNA (uracil1498-N3)-methyltransferase